MQRRSPQRGRDRRCPPGAGGERAQPHPHRAPQRQRAHGLHQRRPQRALDQPERRPLVSQPHLRLGRVHVHVQSLARHLEETGRDREAPRGQQLPVGPLDRVGEAARLDGPSVHEQRHPAPARPMVRRRRRQPLHPQRGGARLVGRPLPGERDRGRRDLSPPDGPEGGPSLPLAAAAQRRPAIDLERDRHRRPGQRGLAADARDGRPLRPGAGQELAPRRLAREEVAHLQRRAGRRRRGRRRARAPVPQLQPPAALLAPQAREAVHRRRRRDARERLAPKAVAAQPLRLLQRAQLGGGVPLEGQGQLRSRDPAAVVAHPDQRQPRPLHRHRDPRRPGVERVLQQLLHHRSGPLDHLPCRDLGGHPLRQPPDRRPRCAAHGRAAGAAGASAAGLSSRRAPSSRARLRRA